MRLDRLGLLPAIAMPAIVLPIGLGGATAALQPPDPAAVVRTYADIALASHGDALFAARDLRRAVEVLVTEPGADTLAAARTAWRRVRVPYRQTEACRFGNRSSMPGSGL